MARLIRFIVRAESWQIFLMFLAAMTLYGLVPKEKELLSIASSILLAVVVFGWFLILGKSLNENLPEEEQKSETLFIVSCFYGILAVSTSSIVGDLQIGEDEIGYIILLVATFGLATFYVIYFVSTLFVSNQERFLQTGKLSPEAVFILFIIFIVGVLGIQPRIKKIFDQSIL